MNLMQFYRRMDMKKLNKSALLQFIKFGMVGGLNSILNIVIYWICVHCGMHYLIANAIGFVITVAISYVLNNIFTFTEKGEKVDWSFLKLLKTYVSYFMTGMVINSILLWFWNDYIGINENLSPILNLFVTVPLNFIINKFWVYRHKKTQEDI